MLKYDQKFPEAADVKVLRLLKGFGEKRCVCVCVRALVSDENQ